MLPIKKEKEFTISVTSGAIVNFLLNLVLIRYYNNIGAAISSVLAEFLVTFIIFIFMKDYIHLRTLSKVMIKYLLGAIIMYFSVRMIAYFMGVSILTTIVQVVVGITVYAIYSRLTKSEVIFYFINRFLKKDEQEL